MFSLQPLFNRQPEPMIGLDISASSIKLVELGKNKVGQYVLERCAIQPLERGWIVDGSIEKFDEVAEAIRRLVAKSGTRAKNVAMALPPSAVISKKIVLPGGLSDTELEMHVEAEASQYIPFPLEEVSLDFCVMGSGTSAEGDVDVLIAASRREKVSDIQGLAEVAGLKPVIVDVESFAARAAAQRLIETMPDQGLGSIVALFEMGALSSSMQVLLDDDVLYERDQAFGGGQLTQMIARQYGFSLEEAEYKKRNAELPEDYAEAVLQPFIDNIVQEIGRALQFFFTSTPYHNVDGILLAGGTAALPGLTETVTRSTTFACSVVNPFEDMEIGPNVQVHRMMREAPSYLTACGLAMRRFRP